MAGTVGIFHDNLINVQSETLCRIGPFRIDGMSCNSCKTLLGWKCFDQNPSKILIHVHMDKLKLWNGANHVDVVGYERTSKKNNKCEVCKLLQKKCPPNCAFFRYFPPGKESETLAMKVKEVFGLPKVTDWIKKFQPPLMDSLMRCIIFEANTRSVNPNSGLRGVSTIIRNLQSRIEHAANDLQVTRANSEMHRLAKKGQPTCPSGTSSWPSFDNASVYYMCRKCRTSIARCKDFGNLIEAVPNRGIFNNTINLKDGVREGDLHCVDCSSILGMKIELATKVQTVLQLDQLLLWNGKYSLEAVPSPADGVAPPGQDMVQEQLVIIEDDNGITQDQIWGDLEAQEPAGDDAV
ncbi:LOB domain-containing protein 22-like [Lycium ferocissimum]|uniref:LOB domain-containing protein 22-like n=1 Tax=Lycium ferocissimum TaxID=112874 RepID=UPI0028156E3D|nr:LOB domain-containing protein 22-like [Lycium ferocissimum]